MNESRYSLRSRKNRINYHQSSSDSSSSESDKNQQALNQHLLNMDGKDSRESHTSRKSGVLPSDMSNRASKTSDKLVSLTPSGSETENSEDDDTSPFSLINESEKEVIDEEELVPDGTVESRRFAQSDKSDMVKFLYEDEGTDPQRGITYQQKVHSLYAKYDKNGEGSGNSSRASGYLKADSRHRTGKGPGMSSSFADYTGDGDDEFDVDFAQDDSRLIANSHDAGRLLNSSSQSTKLTRRRLESSSSSASESSRETMTSIALQVFLPFLVAGLGMVFAGLVLDHVQHWDVFLEITEIFILVPALLGLKGNLEMTLASRLSTQANLGHLDSFADQYYATSGNIALLQCQATVVGFIAALFAILMDWLPEGQFNISHAILLCGSSLLTASIASFILGLIMIAVVIGSHKCNINPDNIATPIAASLGDLTTLYLLAVVSNTLFYSINDSLWLCIVVIIAYLMLIPIWAYVAHNNVFTRDVLYNGWTPVLVAMAISSFGGLILDFAVRRFKGIAVFQPVINGVGGNLVAVQASRLSTYLHLRSKLGQLPKSDQKLCINPWSIVFSNSIHAKTVRVLLLMTIPGHLIFTLVIQVLHGGHTSFTPSFLFIYCSAALVQVFLLLYGAQVMILCMWRRKTDPDNSAIPYLTAIGDLLGGALLALSFMFLSSIGDGDEDVGD